MSTKNWERWVMQTARTWEDISLIIKETGIAPVDHDHRRLTEYALELNELLLGMEKNFSLDLIMEQQKLLDQFFQYTQTHFQREEEFIKKYGIPGLEKQQEEHSRILQMVEGIIFEFKTGRISSAFRLRLQLLDWIINHVNSTDFKIFDFLNICDAILKVDNWNDIRGFIRKVHVPPVDLEHKELTEAIMQTGHAIRDFQTGSEKTIKKISSSLDFVIKKTSAHFRNETEIIKKFDIPGIEIQQDQHGSFLSYLNGQKELLEQNRHDKIEELERELLFWWIQHINIYDSATFLKTNWLGNVFSHSENAEEIAWLINPTGIEEIDNDHFNFVELLFELKYLNNPGIESEKFAEESLEEMNELIEYALMHFRREEKIMEEAGMEILERHNKEHNKIIDNLTAHKTALEEDLLDLTGQLKDVLLDWWIDHTNGIDYETFGAEYEK